MWRGAKLRGRYRLQRYQSDGWARKTIPGLRRGIKVPLPKITVFVTICENYEFSLNIQLRRYIRDTCDIGTKPARQAIGKKKYLINRVRHRFILNYCDISLSIIQKTKITMSSQMKTNDVIYLDSEELGQAVHISSLLRAFYCRVEFRRSGGMQLWPPQRSADLTMRWSPGSYPWMHHRLYKSARMPHNFTPEIWARRSTIFHPKNQSKFVSL